MDDLVEVECPICGRTRMGMDPSKWTSPPACGSCRGRAKESDQLRIKGLIGKIQARAHAGMEGQGFTFTLGTLNISSSYFMGITKDSAPKVEAILRKAREDIMAVCAEEMGWKNK